MPPARHRAVGGFEAPPPTADYAAIPSTMHRSSGAQGRRKSRGLSTCACPAGTGHVSPEWLFRLSARNARRAGGLQGSRVGSRLRSTRGSLCNTGLECSRTKPVQPRARLTHRQRFTKRHPVRAPCPVARHALLAARLNKLTGCRGRVLPVGRRSDQHATHYFSTQHRGTKTGRCNKQGASACECSNYTKCVDHAKNELQFRDSSTGAVARHDCGSGFAPAHPVRVFLLLSFVDCGERPGLAAEALHGLHYPGIGCRLMASRTTARPQPFHRRRRHFEQVGQSRASSEFNCPAPADVVRGA